MNPYTIPGFTIREELHTGIKSVVYRAVRNEDEVTCVLKFPRERISEELTCLYNEHELLANINLAGVTKVLGMHRHDGIYALVREDFGGISLKIFLSKQRFSEHQFCILALKLTDALGQIHSLGIIHKDIKPSNIIFNHETDAVKLTDFGIATALERENKSAAAPGLMEGTLAYISPEQTGRMNRTLDYRSDFYSLGVTFYEILTGQLPFVASDPIELIHCHIAKAPQTPAEINKDISSGLSSIIMKLLAKTPEERYQSTIGLMADIEECLRRIDVEGKIGSFNPGQKDIASILHISEKLYGREEEASLLSRAFNRVCNGAAELILVKGYSGVGKTALVQEVHKPLTREKGYFCAGKFDQFKRDIPYSSLIDAMRDLMAQILTEPEERMIKWRQSIDRSLGVNGGLITAIIPELTHIIGPQPAVQELPPAETNNRFHSVFLSFLRVFADKLHPLVLFLDDLQWADPPTLTMIRTLIVDGDTHYLLLIGAYRDNETPPGHPLLHTINEIEKNRGEVEKIALGPLGLEEITELLRDTFACTKESALELARLTREKTDGNPFFINQFLRSLYADRFILFDARLGWTWQIEQIVRADYTENVVEFMAQKIQQLDTNTQEILRLAACIGNTFDLGTLCVLIGNSIQQTAEYLRPALRARLLLPLDDSINLFNTENSDEGFQKLNARVNYRFLHDRVQQAAYSLIPESARRDLHGRIGRLLLGSVQGKDLEEKVFEITRHLNLGTIDKLSEKEKNELAALNLRAASRARKSNAFAPALHYAEKGRSLLTENDFLNHYQLAFDLIVLTGECAYSCGDFDKANALFDEGLAKANTMENRVRIYELVVYLNTNRGEYGAAIKRAMEGLRSLGIEMEVADITAEVREQFRNSQKALAGRDIPSLADLPEMTSPIDRAKMFLLHSMTGAIFLGDIQLASLLPIHMVILSLRHGNTEYSAQGYALYGMFLTYIVDFGNAYQFGTMAQRLVEKYDTKLKHKVLYVQGATIEHWRRPMRNCVKLLNESYTLSLQYSDHLYACYNIFSVAAVRMQSGESLLNILTDTENYLTVLDRMKMKDFALWIISIRQTILCLQGQTHKRQSMDNENFNEAQHLKLLWASEMKIAVHFHLLQKAFLAYIYGDYKGVRELIADAEPVLDSSNTFLHFTEHNFLDSISITVLYEEQENNRDQFDRALKKNQKYMKRWADSSPENFRHRYLFIEAERARLAGEKWQAADLYDEAVTRAISSENWRDAALILEAFGRFYLAAGRNRQARHTLEEARRYYHHWGASDKAKQMSELYRDFFMGDQEGKTTPSDSTRGESAALDLISVMKASHAISQEIVMESLFARIMYVLFESAGAERGFLLLENNGDLFIEVTGSIEGGINPTHRAPLKDATGLSVGVINLVRRTRESLVLADAGRDNRFLSDEYIQHGCPRSILCAPILNHGDLAGILYLENNNVTGAFTAERLKIAHMIASQAAISIENARLYANLEEKVTIRTQELQQMTNQAERVRQEVEKLNLISKKLNETVNLDEILKGIAEYLREDYGIDSIWLLSIDQKTKDLRTYKYLVPPTVPQKAHDFLNSVSIAESEGGAFWRAHKRKRHTYFPRLSLRSMIEKEAHIARIGHLQSMFIVPLMIQGEVFGILNLTAFRRPLKFTRQEINSLLGFADQIAGAVHSSHLYAVAQNARAEAEAEQKKADDLLKNILPARTAEELKRNGRVEPLFYDMVSVIFTDFVGFTKATQKMLPDKLVAELDGCFSQFDEVIRRNRMEKLKTIGDAYMCAAGLPVLSASHALDACLAALELRSFMQQMAEIKKGLGNPFWEIRIGIHSGPVTAGVIGTSKFAYDIWGDTVNTASRMESTGEPGEINISDTTYDLVKEYFECQSRGILPVKGKGNMEMYFLKRIKPDFANDKDGLVPNRNLVKVMEELSEVHK